MALSYIRLYTTSSGRSWMRLCVTVIESHSRSLKLVPIAEFCMRITIIVHYCDAVYLLWFPRYNDLLVENLHFCRFYPPQSRLKPSQGCSLGSRAWKLVSEN